MTKIIVDIWTDIVCPWCYFGKRRFDRALALFERRDEVAVRHRSFKLDPSAPTEAGETLAERTQRDLGLPTIADARRLHAQVEDLARQEGLNYRLGDARLVNSFDAHRPLHFADEGPQGDAMRERLFAAYAIEGAVISNHETLIRLAVEAGLPGRDVCSVLDTDRYADQVAADRALAFQHGVRGVPHFLFNGEHLVGTQSVEGFMALLDQSLRKESARRT